MLFQSAGTYTVTLTVRDVGGNTDTDTMAVNVISVISVVIGPVLDPEGNPIPGANVTIIIGDNTYYGTTNETGYAVIDIPETDLGGLADVIVVADGFDTVDYTTILGTDGTPSAQPPPMNDATPPDSMPPVANAGADQAVSSGALVTFDGSASTDDVGVANYTWTFTYNGTAVALYGASPTFRFWTTGTYIVTLTVRDAAGNTDSDTMSVKVNATPADDGGFPMWMILVIAIIIIAAIAGLLLMKKGTAGKGAAPEEAASEEEAVPDGSPDTNKVVPGVGVVVKSNNPKGGGSPDDSKVPDSDGDGVPTDPDGDQGADAVAGNPIGGLTISTGHGPKTKG